ncbi:hypothetical protein D3C85_1645660 [compost metagenome]
MYQLYLQDIQSVIIEGGANVLNQFINYGLWDEARVFTGEKTLENGTPAPAVSGKVISSEMIDQDELTIIANKNNPYIAL